MSAATVVFAFTVEIAVGIAYDESPPVVSDQSHAGPRLNRGSAGRGGSREAAGPDLDRESFATRQTGSRGPTISREARD